MKDILMKEINDRVVDHDYKKLFDLAERLSKQVSASLGESVTAQDFLEALGYVLLCEKASDKAYVVYRTVAEYCESKSASFNLGNMFTNGDGVQPNLCAAYYWFFKAAERGVENGTIMCDRILQHVADNGNPISNILYGDKNTALPGLRHAMNVGMFIDSFSAMCERGNDMFPRDLKMAAYLKEKRAVLMEKYK